VAVLTLVLNYVLVPRYGIFGAAWAPVAGFVALALGSYYCSQRVLPLKLGQKRVALAMAIGLGIYLVSLNFSGNHHLPGLALKTAFLCSFPFLIWMTGVFSKEDFALIEAVRGEFGKSGQRLFQPVWLRVATALGHSVK